MPRGHASTADLSGHGEEGSERMFRPSCGCVLKQEFQNRLESHDLHPRTLPEEEKVALPGSRIGLTPRDQWTVPKITSEGLGSQYTAVPLARKPTKSNTKTPDTSRTSGALV